MCLLLCSSMNFDYEARKKEIKKIYEDKESLANELRRRAEEVGIRKELIEWFLIATDLTSFKIVSERVKKELGLDELYIGKGKILAKTNKNLFYIDMWKKEANTSNNYLYFQIKLTIEKIKQVYESLLEESVHFLSLAERGLKEDTHYYISIGNKEVEVDKEQFDRVKTLIKLSESAENTEENGKKKSKKFKLDFDIREIKENYFLNIHYYGKLYGLHGIRINNGGYHFVNDNEGVLLSLRNLEELTSTDIVEPLMDNKELSLNISLKKKVNLVPDEKLQTEFNLLCNLYYQLINSYK